MSWDERSRLGLLRGVIDVADQKGRRNLYMHTLHTKALRKELRRAGRVGRALDFGCGTGRFLKTLSTYCRDVYAIDRAPSMVEAARTYASGHARAISGWTCEDLPYEDGFFDFILCCCVLCVTTRDLFDRSLIEMARVCRRGGAVLLLEHVSSERGLTLNSYQTALSNAGFEISRAYPMRSATSRITTLVTRYSCIPKFIFSALADLELRLTRHRTYPPRVPYVEYVIAARRT